MPHDARCRHLQRMSRFRCATLLLCRLRYIRFSMPLCRLRRMLPFHAAIEAMALLLISLSATLQALLLRYAATALSANITFMMLLLTRLQTYALCRA